MYKTIQRSALKLVLSCGMIIGTDLALSQTPSLEKYIIIAESPRSGPMKIHFAEHIQYARLEKIRDSSDKYWLAKADSTLKLPDNIKCASWEYKNDQHLLLIRLNNWPDSPVRLTIAMYYRADSTSPEEFLYKNNAYIINILQR